jgi:glycolate oxidase FAD binding subunit
VLGVEFVTGDGRIVRGGGRVVKNVAGFDLTRLVTGSWGTIGVITEVTLRLYSLPPHPVSLALTVPDGAAGLGQRLKALLALPINPLAVELVDSEVAGLTGLPCRRTILVALGGNRATVTAQMDAINSLGGMTEIFPEVWKRLRIVDDVPAGTQTYAHPEPNIVFRISALPARIGDLWSSVEKAMETIPGGRMHSSPGLGVVRCILPPSAGFEAVHSLMQACRSVTTVCERMPRELWSVISPTVVGDRVSQGIKRAFDPQNILNPGILGR